MSPEAIGAFPQVVMNDSGARSVTLPVGEKTYNGDPYVHSLAGFVSKKNIRVIRSSASLQHRLSHSYFAESMFGSVRVMEFSKWMT